jgi:hypothetical protein
MTHVFMINDTSGSSDFGKEVARPATVVEVPPIIVWAIRAYKRDSYGLHSFTEAWMKELPKDLERALTPPKNQDRKQALKKVEENLDKIAEFRILVATQPRLASVPKKKPDLMEIKVAGATTQEQFEYVKELLGKIVSATDIFSQNFVPQGSKDKTRYCNPWTLAPCKSSVQHPKSRANGLSPTHRIQQTHPENRLRWKPSYSERRISTLWTNQRIIYAHRRQLTRSNKAPNKIALCCTFSKNSSGRASEHCVHIT